MIAPNPASTMVNILRDGDVEDTYNVKIVNQNGRVLSELLNNSMDKLEINISHFGSGLIWIRIEDEKNVSIRKLVIVRD